MNIFVTSYHPKRCALEHCLVHRNKMLVEYAQIMSTCHSIWGTHQTNMYRPTHVGHPSVKWAAKAEGNYIWLYKLWTNLAHAYTLYTGKMHQSYEKLGNVLALEEKQAIITPQFHRDMLAMPEQYRQDDVKLSYQSYLRAKFKEWENRAKPMRVVFDGATPHWMEN